MRKDTEARRLLCELFGFESVEFILDELPEVDHRHEADISPNFKYKQLKAANPALPLRNLNSKSRFQEWLNKVKELFRLTDEEMSNALKYLDITNESIKFNKAAKVQCNIYFHPDYFRAYNGQSISSDMMDIMMVFMGYEFIYFITQRKILDEEDQNGVSYWLASEFAKLYGSFTYAEGYNKNLPYYYSSRSYDDIKKEQELLFDKEYKMNNTDYGSGVLKVRQKILKSLGSAFPWIR